MSDESNYAARDAVLDDLRDDHERALSAFESFGALDPAESPDEAEAIVARVCDELDVHATVEEELFYPEVRAHSDQAPFIEKSEMEHAQMRKHIEDLRLLSPEDESFAATFTVMAEDVQSHIRDEEDALFESLDDTTIDWQALRQKMQVRKAELMAELGLTTPGMEDDSDCKLGKVSV